MQLYPRPAVRPRHTLRRKLPLLISSLLCVAVLAVGWSAYRQVEVVLIQTTGARLAGASERLGALLEESARRVRRDARSLAAEPSLAAALAHPTETSVRAARATLERARTQASQPTSYTLWSRDGERRLAVGPLVRPGDGIPARSTGPGGAPVDAGPLVRADGGVMYHIVAPVLGADRDTLGMLVVYRRLSSGSTADDIAELVGRHATLLVGNASGDLWTDFGTVVAGPPPSFPVGAPREFTTATGERQLGAAAPVRGTPWLVLIHAPRDAALAPTRQFLLDVAGVALGIVALGGLAAWALSNRVTAPLAEVTRAAEDLARGDYTRRVGIARRDEIGSLAGSFNAMAAQVQDAARGLQARARELEAANASLRASEERYRRLVEAAHEGICVVDPAGTITYANARLAELLGYTADALPGRSIFEFMDPATAFEARTAFARQQRGIAETREIPFRRKDGSTLWTNKTVSSLFDADGSFTGALCMLSDVTERHEAQARLERSERHFRALIENASDLISVLDGRGIVRYVSPSLQRYQSGIADSIVGAPAVARIHPEDVPAAEAALARILAEPREPVRVQYRYRDARGGWRHLSSIATNLLDDPTVEGIVVNSRDVTDERTLEAQLLHSQKMDAVGQLAGGVAHDFNNLLAVMTSYTGVLLADLPPDDPIRPDLEEIRRAAERAAALTRQLLAFSRQQVLQPRVLDLNAVVRDLEKMLVRVLREDVRLETVLAPALGPIHADPGQLEQVIVNLALNSRDAMPDGGALTIETAELELDEEYCRTRADVTPGRYVMLAVSDTGVGMDAATQARAFEPFFTTKEVGKGTGLGLATVYGIVKQSGGHVAVYSEPGVGTSVRVYLPLDRSSPPGRLDSGPHPTVHRGTGTILLVEDEAPVRAAARRILDRAGYVVIEAANGPEALRRYEEHVRNAGTIDVVLTDLVMPTMSGRELAARLRELQPGIATAFMSGYTEDAVLRQGAFDHAAVFVPKPFTPETLTQKLREALDACAAHRAGELAAERPSLADVATA